MKEFIKKIIPRQYHSKIISIRNDLFDGHHKKSYSQEGEDMILSRIFENQQKGFYVDVGAHHPKRFSNTYFFYKKGWTGINIDAMPGSMKLFRTSRKRDINLEVAISENEETIKYYAFREPALNSFSKSLSESKMSTYNAELLYTKDIKTVKLATVLKNYLVADQDIDFLSVDVEGLDLSVLKSNEWARYRPKVVLVEVLDNYLDEVIDNEVYKYMIKKGYRLYAKSMNTVIFMDITT